MMNREKEEATGALIVVCAFVLGVGLLAAGLSHSLLASAGAALLAFVVAMVGTRILLSRT
jgi:hypothetical protein